MSNATLEITGLTSGYGDAIVIDALDLHVRTGERLALLGRNGVGKTTLLATLFGLTRRFSGTVTLGDWVISEMPVSARARAGLGYVPQTRNIFKSLTVEENLRVGLKARPRRAIAESFELFPRLRERRSQVASRLSGGEQQMLSTARTLLGRPRILLLDEPLEGLAPVICDELMQALKTLGETDQITIVLVEQQIDRALAFADRAAIMERGKLVWQGDAEDTRSDPRLVERYLSVAG